MGWDKVSADLAVILNDLVSGYDCQKKPMFGCPVYFVNNNMFTGRKSVRKSNDADLFPNNVRELVRYEI